MSENLFEGRISRHPVLKCEEPRLVKFKLNGTEMSGREGEMVSSALFANGVQVFGHHHKDRSPQGLFCANGQCSQCTLIINGVPLKSCIVPLKEGMQVRTLEGLPSLEDLPGPDVPSPGYKSVDVLIIGAGPAGLAAAIELGKVGADTLIVDDKDRPGGKLVLQTHKFFGSEEDCYAGTRGIDIAEILSDELNKYESVTTWLESVVLAVFSDKKVGIRSNDGYHLIEPKCLLVAAGAREKTLPFSGNDLPGVFGAGAFQTLVNRDLIKCSDRIFVLGGGNVGLIAAYHALQAGMEVAGLAEALEKCSGYKVHADKILRLGIPIYTRHTVLAAHGREHLESVTIAAVDEKFRSIRGTEKTFRVDTLLVAVGLTPVDEFYRKAVEFKILTYVAGDAEEIAEASAAMFSGKIKGMEIARELGLYSRQIPSDWAEKADILKKPGGTVYPYHVPETREGVFPVIHCTQIMPCNPCMTICPKDLIKSDGHPILGIPVYKDGCIGCEKCVAVCPGLAITLVDFRKSSLLPVVTVPYELGEWILMKDQELIVTDWEGIILGNAKLLDIKEIPGSNRTVLLKLETPARIAARVAGIRIQDSSVTQPECSKETEPVSDEVIICRCERVTAGEIREHLRNGVRDMNHLKALTRAGFGACGGKTCKTLIEEICRQEGIAIEELEDFTERPLFAETRLGFFTGRTEN